MDIKLYGGMLTIERTGSVISIEVRVDGDPPRAGERRQEFLAEDTISPAAWAALVAEIGVLR